MPSPETFLAFVAACLVLIIMPGPCLALVTARSATQGTAAGLAAVVGNGAGTLVLGGAVAVGVAGLVAGSPTVLVALRVAGAAYLAFLAWQVLSKAMHPTPLPTVASIGTLGIVRQSFLVNLLNPKGVVFYLAFLPQFAVGSTVPVGLQVLVLCALHITLMMTIEACLALSVGRARAWLDAGPRMRRVQQGALGATFAAVAVAVAVGV